jgi:hypothetical protein
VPLTALNRAPTRDRGAGGGLVGPASSWPTFRRGPTGSAKRAIVAACPSTVALMVAFLAPSVAVFACHS